METLPEGGDRELPQGTAINDAKGPQTIADYRGIVPEVQLCQGGEHLTVHPQIRGPEPHNFSMEEVFQ